MSFAMAEGKAVLDKVEEEVDAQKRKTKKPSWWRRLFGKTESGDGTDAYGLTESQREKFKGAVPLFDQRIKQLTKEKDWAELARVLTQSAKLHLLLGDRAKCAETMAAAATAYLRQADSPTSDFLKLYASRMEQAIDEALCGAHYRIAATYEVELSRFLRRSNDEVTYDVERSMVHLKEAARLYKRNEQVQLAIDCEVAVALELEKGGEFGGAAALWLSCAEACVEVPLLRMNAVKYEMSYMLCVAAGEVHDTAGDAPSTTDCLGDILVLDPQLTPKRKEVVFLNALADAVSARSPQQLAQAQSAYLTTHTFEDHHLPLLASLQRFLKESPESFT